MHDYSPIPSVDNLSFHYHIQADLAKQQQNEADNSSLSSAEVKNTWKFTSTPPALSQWGPYAKVQLNLLFISF
jgi:hypothetical protein